MNNFIIKTKTKKVKEKRIALGIDILITRVIIRTISDGEEKVMIICYSCKKEIQEVSDIGEIVRSLDGDDFCFCKKCSEEFKRMDERERKAVDGE